MIKPTKAKTVREYIAAIDQPRRGEIQKLHAFIRKAVPDLEPHLASGMIGYGRYHYAYESGRQGDWFQIGLASQKSYISVYVCASDNGTYVAERHRKLLPKANVGRSCIRFKKLADIDLDALGRVVREGARVMSKPAAKPKARPKSKTKSKAKTA